MLGTDRCIYGVEVYGTREDYSVSIVGWRDGCVVGTLVVVAVVAEGL